MSMTQTKTNTKTDTQTKTNTKTDTQTKTNTKCYKDPMLIIFLKSTGSKDFKYDMDINI